MSVSTEEAEVSRSKNHKNLQKNLVAYTASRAIKINTYLGINKAICKMHNLMLIIAPTFVFVFLIFSF